MDKQSTCSLTKYPVIFFSWLFIHLFSSVTAAEILLTDKFILPPQHTSYYELEKYGAHLGDMVNNLTYDNKIVTYTSTAIAKGLATLFISDDPTELSILNIQENNSLQQKSYQYTQGKNHKKNQRIDFLWDLDKQLNIQGTYKHKDYAIKTTGIVWARQVLPILMSNDLQHDEKKINNAFFIANKGSINNFSYAFETKEALKLNKKTFEVLKFKIQKHGSRRFTYAWLSKTHYYLPLKLEQYKDNKLNIRMLMTKLKYHD